MLNLFQHPAGGNLRLMPTEKQPCVYLLANKPFGTIYIGVTSDLVARLWQHREGAVEGFSKRYAVHRLVHFELFDTMESAIKREKQLKNWHRDWKLNLITRENPDWRDLAVGLGFDPPRSDERKAGP
ncbi:GIY-YIG nuclease family protein [Alteriqipengyuania lutimaris]|uniref:GIY-YIG nuclease family protein n=2 Tax=Alteriqipengyuania lutimaris TaxID=1538146 RepID=A0A395LNX2_9SPHN|nr:GIY-YIG nuclease family protein [Alteriqipengyuania lutimaris]